MERLVGLCCLGCPDCLGLAKWPMAAKVAVKLARAPRSTTRNPCQAPHHPDIPTQTHTTFVWSKIVWHIVNCVSETVGLATG